MSSCLTLASCKVEVQDFPTSLPLVMMSAVPIPALLTLAQAVVRVPLRTCSSDVSAARQDAWQTPVVAEQSQVITSAYLIVHRLPYLRDLFHRGVILALVVLCIENDELVGGQWNS